MEQRPTPEQSLQLINDMMAQARRSHQKVNFYFLLWGVLFALAGIAAHVLFRSGWEFHWIVWPIAGVLGGIISGVRGSREGKQQHSSTFMDRVHQWLWISYVITLVLMIIALVNFRIDPNPFVLLLTALPTFVSGALMRFTPLMIGGILFWAIGFASFFVFREYSAIVYSIGITVGYIVPGILLKRQEDGLRTA